MVSLISITVKEKHVNVCAFHLLKIASHENLNQHYSNVKIMPSLLIIHLNVILINIKYK